jgi:hypothetical protein
MDGRWKVEISYVGGTVETEVFTVEELEELQAIVERGHHWNFIDRIVIALNRQAETKAA